MAQCMQLVTRGYQVGSNNAQTNLTHLEPVTAAAGNCPFLLVLTQAELTTLQSTGNTQGTQIGQLQAANGQNQTAIAQLQASVQALQVAGGGGGGSNALLPPLTPTEGATLASAVLLAWAVAWVWRMLAKQVMVAGEGLEHSEKG
jgi:hypothetical protein